MGFIVFVLNISYSFIIFIIKCGEIRHTSLLSWFRMSRVENITVLLLLFIFFHNFDFYLKGFFHTIHSDHCFFSPIFSQILPTSTSKSTSFLSLLLEHRQVKTEYDKTNKILEKKDPKKRHKKHIQACRHTPTFIHRSHKTTKPEPIIQKQKLCKVKKCTDKAL